MWGDKLTAAAWSGCDLHATEKLQLAILPFCFWLCMPAFSQRRLNIEVLFSLRIDVFFPRSLSLTRAHTQHTEAVLTCNADGDSLLKRKSSQYDWSLLWGALFLSSILQGIFVSQHSEGFFLLAVFVCEKRNFCSLCSVCQCYCPNNDLPYFSQFSLVSFCLVALFLK